MRILFAGSPAIAVPSLQLLYDRQQESGLELVGILTRPDAPKGRKGEATPCEIGCLAEQLASDAAARGKPIPAILKFPTLKQEAREAIAALRPDILVSFAYGKIFGPKFLALFPRGGINLHPSLLPRYRGAAPIPAAILNRDSETGLTVQRIALEMDSGDILAQEPVSLSGIENTQSLSDYAATRGAGLLLQVLRDIACGREHATPQDHSQATWCPMLHKEDGRIDWQKSAAEIDAQIRAYTPWPLSFGEHAGKKVYILQACPAAASESEDAKGVAQPKTVPGQVLGCDKKRGILIQTGDGILEVQRLQYESKKAQDYQSFINGARDFANTVLTVASDR